MSKPTHLVYRLKRMLENGDGVDVYFMVGQGDKKEIVYAHKFMLKDASEVFERMFKFDSKTDKGKEHNPIVIPDIDGDAFKAMLSFIYSDYDDLSKMNGENVVAVLYAAKKYNIAHLMAACTKFPIMKLHNVFFALQQARQIEEQGFSNRCLNYIELNAETLFQLDIFLKIDQNLLCELLGRDQLLVKEEIVIWNAALRWADANCRQNGLECTVENRRTMLGPALYEIRFPLVSQEQFSNQIVPLHMLNVDEQNDVDLCFFSQMPRRSRFFSIQKRSNYKESNKCIGLFLIKIENFLEFSGEPIGSVRRSNTVYIQRHAWNIAIYKQKLYFNFYLETEADKTRYAGPGQRMVRR